MMATLLHTRTAHSLHSSSPTASRSERAGSDTPTKGRGWHMPKGQGLTPTRVGTDTPIQGAGTDMPTKGQIVSVGLMLSPCVILCVIGCLIANSLGQ